MTTDDVLRLCQCLFVAYIGLFALVVALNNCVDYGSNFSFVQHVMSMDTTFPGNRLVSRAVHAAWVHHAVYQLIIALEALVAALCLAGSWKLAFALSLPVENFHAAKALALAGLGLGFTLWFAIFMIGAGQWWASWQSKDYSGQLAAFQFYVPIAAVILIVMQRV